MSKKLIKLINKEIKLWEDIPVGPCYVNSFAEQNTAIKVLKTLRKKLKKDTA